MLQERALARHLRRWPLTTADGTLWREVEYIHLSRPDPQPLWSEGPVRSGARYTPPGSFPTLYLTFDRSTTSLEIGAVFQSPDGTPIPLDPRPTTLIPVAVRIDGVLDLFDSSLLHALRTSAQELTGEWRYTQAKGMEPATQRLGRLAHRSGRI